MKITTGVHMGSEASLIEASVDIGRENIITLASVALCWVDSSRVVDCSSVAAQNEAFMYMALFR